MRRQTIAVAVVLVFAILIAGLSLVRPRSANASRFCDTFREPSLLTQVQVYANRYVSCDRAVRVMKRRFDGDTPAGWSCVGPQTGYAKCTKGRKRVVAHF